MATARMSVTLFFLFFLFCEKMQRSSTSSPSSSSSGSRRVVNNIVVPANTSAAWAVGSPTTDALAAYAEDVSSFSVEDTIAEQALLEKELNFKPGALTMTRLNKMAGIVDDLGGKQRKLVEQIGSIDSKGQLLTLKINTLRKSPTPRGTVGSAQSSTGASSSEATHHRESSHCLWSSGAGSIRV